MGVDKRKENLIVDIISYGIMIEANDRIYRLFERSENAAKMSGGTGVGLYVVKKICRAHGGDVSHQSEKLSDYNIPILVNYIHDQRLVTIIPDRKNEFDDAYNSLSGVLEKEVVCDSSFVKYSRVFSSRIDTPTYRNTFRVEIPLI